ncbi:OmpA family protein [Antribacter gilvus]|uniref:OmpA family protein n=1 Tax=Antribacter gilvus TaxID=2304675 RepID=UPI000F79232C|nr:OmpA family protein [Antribacter gilvus]
MSRRRRVVTPIVVTAVGFGLLTGAQDTFFRDGVIEAKLTTASEAALAEAGLGEVEVSFAGRDATVLAQNEDDGREAADVVEGVEGVRVVRALMPAWAAGTTGDEDEGEESSASPSASASASPSASTSATPSASPSTSPSTTPAPTPTAAPQAVQEQLVAIPAITFVTDSADLTPEGRATVEQAAAVLLANPDITVRIEGHTDSVGAEDRNLALSQGRAQTVLTTLVGLGVAPERLSAQGFGESVPKVAESTPQDQAINRRVDFVVQQTN